MVHKKEEGTYQHIEALMKEMPGFLSPWDRLAINKEQRIPDRSKTAHRKPPVKCFLTQSQTTWAVFTKAKQSEQKDNKNFIHL